MNRRVFLTTSLSTSFLKAAKAGQITREVFLHSPGKGTAVLGYAYYTAKRGGAMASLEQRWSRSDTIDIAYLRRSTNYGKTWSEPTPIITGERRPEGMWRKHVRGGFVDPHTGRYLEFWVEGVLPSDDPLEGMRQWNIFYSVNNGPAQQVVHEGNEFNAKHPLPGVFTGQNSVMLGDSASRPVSAPNGTILLPVAIAPVDGNGKLFNPAGAYTFHDSAVLIGRWKGNTLQWQSSNRIAADPERATRGMDEPTLARLASGKWICVMRGSNDKRPTVPSYRWIATSADQGLHWTKPEPWTYTTGEPFFSPSACSQLIPHSSGRLFWAGNISPENARGNRPRYPFVIGEVDRNNGLLRKDSLRIVDDKKPDEDPILSLSNFFAREDRQTKEIVIHMTRWFPYPNAWEGDAFLYRVPV